jgi:hypothetical protein
MSSSQPKLFESYSILLPNIQECQSTYELTRILQDDPFANPSDIERQSLTQGAQTSSDSGNIVTNTFRQSSHPVAAFFHVVFKITAIIIYLFASLINSFILTFVILVLCK